MIADFQSALLTWADGKKTKVPYGGYFYFILLKIYQHERINNMKKTFQTYTSLLLAILMLFCLVSCNKVEKTGLWENATYRRDEEFGKGAKTIVVEVEAEEQVVTFTVHTDKDTVGAALLEHQLISGDEGAYGLYVKVVNGITADYDIDQSYWSFYVNGEYAMSGVDMTEIDESAVYRLVYTK